MQKAKRQTARRQADRSERREKRANGDVSELVPVANASRAALVVEADPEVQARLARNLSRRGHRVVGTGSGDGALALISQWDVDLVLISDDLPGRTGIEVARLVHQARPKATVVLMCDNLEPGTLPTAVEDEANLQGLAFGGGLYYQSPGKFSVGLDYAYRYLGVLGPTNFFTVSLGF